jgi:proline dehydrogenase
MATLRRRLLFNLITNQRLERGVHRSPTLERRAYAAARRYVAGETVQDMLRVVAGLHDGGIAASVDCFGELVADPATAERATADYVRLARTLAQVEDAWLAIDLSHIGLDVSVDVCRRHLATIVEALPAGRRIQVGAEDSSRTDPILEVVTALVAEGAPLMATVQANLRRSPGDVARLAAAGVPVRLVKGAYREPPSLAFPRKQDVDANYVALMKTLLDHGVYPAIATHDEKILREAIEYVRERGIRADSFEFQMLYGIRRDLQRQLIEQGYRLRLYVPYGTEWYPYFMRRLAERPANLWFVLKNLLK